MIADFEFRIAKLKGILKLVVLLNLLNPLVPLNHAVAQEARALAKLDTTRLLIGQQVTMKLSLTVPGGTYVHWPVFDDSLAGGVELVEALKPDTVYSADKKSLEIRQDLRITSFDTGVHLIPSVPFYQRTGKGDTMALLAMSNELMFSVTALPVDTTKAIKDIKGPMKAPWTLRELMPYILGGLALILVIAALIWYFRRRRANRPIIPLPVKAPVPPHVTALEELERLRQAHLWQGGLVKEYHTGLTDILRVYFHGRFGFDAMEMTTDEILENLRMRNVSAAAYEEMKQILTVADLVKFAKEQPLPDRHDQSMRQAINFVNLTTSAPEVKSPEL